MMRRLIQVLMMFAVIAFAPPASAEEGPIVDAPAGRVQGLAVGEVEIFRGIAYARAPLGDLRWRPPARMPRWRGLRDASQFGPACVQPASPFFDYAATSEDCLFLNIWAPRNARHAPVLFWIHGGSLLNGSGSDPIFDGSRFAERGIIVVSINYRLGVLGWLAHPELSAESRAHVSGNYGLMDQIEALRWVRRNIGAFGGDLGNITIAGESAGALSVMYLMAAPEARGLFHRAIAQSGYMITMPELRSSSYADWPAAETMGAHLASHLGAVALDGLRAMDAQAIVEGVRGSGYFPLGVVDGRTLPRQLVDTFDRGEQARVPVLTGFNEGEIRSLRFLLAPAPADASSYTREIRTRYGDLAEAFLAQYPADDISESMLAATRDAMYGWTAERLAAKQAEIGAVSFLYYFDHGYPAADEAGFRAFHAAEIPFVFGTIGATPRYWPVIPQNAEEQRLSDAMLSYWTTFARNGVPGAEGEEAWRPYGLDRSYMAFEDAARMRVGPPNGYEIHEAVVCRRRARRVTWNWNVGVIAPILPESAPGCQ
ncbi:MAG: carboxylesterase family protein [Hyphomonadaceae bacterium JAD_PAG50586_4]|nr:MAG: carboxylesterase family protein [Hyphomonadaceae bacterium JAD_PAG50586_4]